MIVIDALPLGEFVTTLTNSPEEHLAPSLRRIIKKPLLGLELFSFVSKKRARDTNSSQGGSLKILGYITTTLHQLILNVEVEVLHEVFNLYIEANSLLDCAAVMGLETKELLQ